jgi:hypothetical protein
LLTIRPPENKPCRDGPGSRRLRVLPKLSDPVRSIGENFNTVLAYRDLTQEDKP